MTLKPATKSCMTRRKISAAAPSGVGERSLIYIPIIHAAVDMGALTGVVQQLKIRKLGRKGLARNISLVDRLWTEIENTIGSMPLLYKKVRLYQDGLPVCSREVEIVAELAKAGARNHQLLIRLYEQGATIMGTESSELLVKEYMLIKETLASGGPVGTTSIGARQDSLLKMRDMSIAQRINETLCAGETGILFIGMLHRVAPWLDKDIRVTYPLDIKSLSLK